MIKISTRRLERRARGYGLNCDWRPKELANIWSAPPTSAFTHIRMRGGAFVVRCKDSGQHRRNSRTIELSARRLETGGPRQPLQSLGRYATLRKRRHACECR